MGKSKPRRPIAIVVEDDRNQREIIAVLLEETDMHVIECSSAEAGLAALDLYKSAVAFLFTDVSLAGEMSGVELARIAKRHYPHLAVIVTSGRPCSGVPQDATFMPKPWNALDGLVEAERSLARDAH